jgi:hypothetical protein
MQQPQWQYLVETIDSLGLPTRLNELGKAGWELVSTSYTPATMVRPGIFSNQFILIFIRQTPEPDVL